MVLVRLLGERPGTSVIRKEYLELLELSEALWESTQDELGGQRLSGLAWSNTMY